MTHLDAREYHAHRTSCLSGGEFPCHVTLDRPHDPLFDADLRPARGRKGLPRGVIDPNADYSALCLQFGVNEGNLPVRHPAAGSNHVSRKFEAEL
jgi:hypothetical protein